MSVLLATLRAWKAASVIGIASAVAGMITAWVGDISQPRVGFITGPFMVTVCCIVYGSIYFWAWESTE